MLRRRWHGPAIVASVLLVGAVLVSLWAAVRWTWTTPSGEGIGLSFTLVFAEVARGVGVFYLVVGSALGLWYGLATRGFEWWERYATGLTTILFEVGVTTTTVGVLVGRGFGSRHALFVVAAAGGTAPVVVGVLSDRLPAGRALAAAGGLTYLAVVAFHLVGPPAEPPGYVLSYSLLLLVIVAVFGGPLYLAGVGLRRSVDGPVRRERQAE